MPASAPRMLNRPRPAKVRIGPASDAKAEDAGARSATPLRGDDAHDARRDVCAPRDAHAPITVDGEQVELVRETWLVEDRWWTDSPVRRRYWDLLSVKGRNVVVFHDLCSGRWFTQAA